MLASEIKIQSYYLDFIRHIVVINILFYYAIINVSAKYFTNSILIVQGGINLEIANLLDHSIYINKVSDWIYRDIVETLNPNPDYNYIVWSSQCVI